LSSDITCTFFLFQFFLGVFFHFCAVFSRNCTAFPCLVATVLTTVVSGCLAGCWGRFFFVFISKDMFRFFPDRDGPAPLGGYLNLLFRCICPSCSRLLFCVHSVYFPLRLIVLRSHEVRSNQVVFPRFNLLSQSRSCCCISLCCALLLELRGTSPGLLEDSLFLRLMRLMEG